MVQYPEDWSVTGYLAKEKERVEKRLDELPLRPCKQTQAFEAMRYALGTPGKRFRPLLVIAASDIYRKGQDAFTLDCAAAVECIHTASLLFDDLPSMDDAKLRRGRETTHRIYGEAQAILAGMSLIAEANILISGEAASADKRQARKKLACVAILNDSFSLEGLSGGQSDDLLNKMELDFAELEYIHAKKTGALFEACTSIAAVIGEANDRETGWLRSYAKNLGLAFQIQDDLLDLKGSAQTGKDQFKDADKTTFLDLFGEEKCKRVYRELFEVALANLEPFGSAAGHIIALTQMIQKRDF